MPQFSHHCNGNNSPKRASQPQGQPKPQHGGLGSGWREDSRRAAPHGRSAGSLPSATREGRHAVSFLATRWRPPPQDPNGQLTSSAASWPRSSGFSSGNRSSCSPAMVTSWSRSPREGGREENEGWALLLNLPRVEEDSTSLAGQGHKGPHPRPPLPPHHVPK